MMPQHGPNQRLEAPDRPAEFPAVVCNIAAAEWLQGVGGGVLLGDMVDDLKLSTGMVELHESERQLSETGESAQPFEQKGQVFRVADRGWQGDLADPAPEEDGFQHWVFWVEKSRQGLYLYGTVQVEKVTLGKIQPIRKSQPWCALVRLYALVLGKPLQETGARVTRLSL